MPREVSDIKQFLEICRRKDASSARIKRNRKSQQIKFKVRCQRFIYTLVLKESDKADKLKQSLPLRARNIREKVYQHLADTTALNELSGPLLTALFFYPTALKVVDVSNGEKKSL